MANYVRGPFIEFECSACGTTCQENAPTKHDRLVDRISQANADPSTRICAGCWNPPAQAAKED